MTIDDAQAVVLDPESLRMYVERSACWADALIEIAAGFRHYAHSAGTSTFCLHCLGHMQNGCQPECPGLLARKTLGVA